MDDISFPTHTELYTASAQAHRDAGKGASEEIGREGEVWWEGLISGERGIISNSMELRILFAMI